MLSSYVTVSAGDWPYEISWILSCTPAATSAVAETFSGGAPWGVEISIPQETTCTLIMNDNYGDGWDGAQWQGFGQTFGMTHGSQSTKTFYVGTSITTFPPPAPSPPPSNSYRVKADVCPGSTSTFYGNQCAHMNGGFGAIRCCKGDGSCGGSVCTGSSTHSGASQLYPLTGISSASATFQETMDECSAQGMRLCTLSEVSACCSTGCNYDSSHVWTSTVCDNAGPYGPGILLPPPPSPSPPSWNVGVGNGAEDSAASVFENTALLVAVPIAVGLILGIIRVKLVARHRRSALLSNVGGGAQIQMFARAGNPNRVVINGGGGGGGGSCGLTTHFERNTTQHGAFAKVDDTPMGGCVAPTVTAVPMGLFGGGNAAPPPYGEPVVVNAVAVEADAVPSSNLVYGQTLHATRL